MVTPQIILTRAYKGFESGLDYMMRRDNRRIIATVQRHNEKYDEIRDENYTGRCSLNGKNCLQV